MQTLLPLPLPLPLPPPLPLPLADVPQPTGRCPTLRAAMRCAKISCAAGRCADVPLRHARPQ
jgi:hypothetical protein